MEKKKTTRSASSSNGRSGQTTASKAQQNGKSNSRKSTRSQSDSDVAEAGMDEMLEKLFVDQIKDIYYAEKLLSKALPKLAKAATTEELKQALTDHKTETDGQIERLEEVFELLGKKAQAKKCEAMDGLKKEADSIVEETEAGSLTRDVGIIMACQKVEHYEIASYGCLTKLARTFGMEDVASLLHQNLEEEKAADELLTSIAEDHVNYEAGMESED
ncbi:MAG: YciE/YciF ferroxidase family protein [Pseudobacter sp.]|uniref:YciE/YciF ferroxidase family protein n=1 Tax=Pseudobacter sp. TaxID=2045420 RepID=UPI003F7DF355